MCTELRTYAYTVIIALKCLNNAPFMHTLVLNTLYLCEHLHRYESKDGPLFNNCIGFVIIY